MRFGKLITPKRAGLAVSIIAANIALGLAVYTYRPSCFGYVLIGLLLLDTIVLQIAIVKRLQG